MKYAEKLEIYERAQRIVTSDNIDWKTKFDLIFSDEVSDKIKFDWCDPDMDYEDDVKAFMQGFNEHMTEQAVIAKQIDLEI